MVQCGMHVMMGGYCLAWHGMGYDGMYGLGAHVAYNFFFYRKKLFVSIELENIYAYKSRASFYNY